MNCNRIAIGTAQFGMEYGISNKAGKVDKVTAAEILRIALDSGLDSLDTAVAYGDSEKLLGEIGVERWRVISKLPEMPQEVKDPVSWVEYHLEESLSRLKVKRLYGLLLHRPEQLLGDRGGGLYAALRLQQAKGLVSKVGVSIYSPLILKELFRTMEFDIVQAPFNVLDQRLLNGGWLNRLKGAKCELHVRSVFLQGLLLLKPEERPPQFRKWSPIWDRWDAWLTQSRVTPLQACIRFVSKFQEVSRIIIGIETADQLLEILASAEGTIPPLPDQMNVTDEGLINPGNWTRK